MGAGFFNLRRVADIPLDSPRGTEDTGIFHSEVPHSLPPNGSRASCDDSKSPVETSIHAVREFDHVVHGRDGFLSVFF